MMGKWIILSLALLVVPSIYAADAEELVFLTWENYVDSEIVSEFEQREHCKIRFVYFSDDDERNMILANTNATGFDLVLLDHAILYTYLQHDWLAPLTFQQIPNARFIQHPWQEKSDVEPLYAISYFWGGVGIIYRKDLMQPAPTHWRDMFQVNPEHKNKLLMLNTVQTTYGLALLASGFPFNSTDPQQVDIATQLLIQSRPMFKEYRNIRLSEDSDLIQGTIIAAVAYNGDAMTLMQYSPQLDFVYPSEGVPLWLDMIGVLKKSKHQPLAYKFLNFINQPEIAARNALSIHYATANAKALTLLPDTFKQDRRVFPDLSQKSNYQLYERLPTQHMRRITTQLVQIMAHKEP